VSIKSNITDPSTGHQAQVDYTIGEDQALVVATRPLKIFTNKTLFFTSEDYGIDMNIGVEIEDTSSTVNVHDGTDNVYWTASAISGNWTFNSTDQNHTPGGQYSIDGTDTKNNNEAQFARGSDLDLTDYNSLSGWVYYTQYNAGANIDIYGWDTGTGLIVGNSADIENFTNTGILNSWQSFIIPLEDMGLSYQTVDAVRVKTIKGTAKKEPNYYLDDIRFNPKTGTAASQNSPGVTGDVGTFVVEPDRDTWFHVHKLTLTFAAAYDSTVADGTMPGIPHEGILGVTLTNGIVYQGIQGGEVQFSTTFLNLIDFIQFPTATIVTQGSDGTFTWFSIDFDYVEPAILKSENSDKLQYIISDNLSGLDFFRIAIAGEEEIRD